jgi:quercetin dioxygenase-like cupin family protein
MRMLITGTDSDGKSCVVSEVDFGGEHGRKMFFWSVAPPPPRPDGSGARLAPRLAENTLHWQAGTFPRNQQTTGMHHTDSFDFFVMVEGWVDLVLDDGPHRLETGDGAVITGVDHGWLTGPDGATNVILQIATPPRLNDDAPFVPYIGRNE